MLQCPSVSSYIMPHSICMPISFVLAGTQWSRPGSMKPAHRNHIPSHRYNGLLSVAGQLCQWDEKTTVYALKRITRAACYEKQQHPKTHKNDVMHALLANCTAQAIVCLFQRQVIAVLASCRYQAQRSRTPPTMAQSVTSAAGRP